MGIRGPDMESGQTTLVRYYLGGMSYTPEELARIVSVRKDFESGVAKERHERLGVSDQQIARSIGAAPNLVGRWTRKERRPSPALALRYWHLIETIEKAIGS
jgi:DNA-binding transcriptional regulator YiaG